MSRQFVISQTKEAVDTEWDRDSVGDGDGDGDGVKEGDDETASWSLPMASELSPFHRISESLHVLWARSP